MSAAKKPISIFWFRRDLRLEDNRGLSKALQGEQPVLPLFLFDENILKKLPKKDARVEFIQQQITKIAEELEQKGSTLLVKHGDPEKIWQQLFEQYNVQAVYTNEDYEPYARERDAKIIGMCTERDISFYAFTDQVIFAKDEVLTEQESVYQVYTPYSRKWKQQLTKDHLKTQAVGKYAKNFFQKKSQAMPSLQDLGFEETGQKFPETTIPVDIIKNYKEQRDTPSIHGTTHFGFHLRFGTVSVRELVGVALELSETWLNELIWREFFLMILWHYPETVNEPFRKKYKGIAWRNDEQEFEKWCAGKTGYPLVDAGMRELNETGFMHNRVRMVTASFLCKDLLIDWRWGERYFAEKLLDFELASNVGNWQWVAGTGCDAAPYFRIFNPESQRKKFDPENEYITKWVPEWNTEEYPESMVDHKKARERTLRAYKKAIDS